MAATMNLITITAQQLRQAADIQEKIQSLQKELSQILGATAKATEGELPRGRQKRKRKMSAAGRAAIAAAARARWAKLKSPRQAETERGKA